MANRLGDLGGQPVLMTSIRSFKADLDLTGSGTMLAAPVPDDPQATFGEAYEEWSRLPSRPLLAIVDSRGQIRNWESLQKQPWWRGLSGFVLRGNAARSR